MHCSTRTSNCAIAIDSGQTRLNDAEALEKHEGTVGVTMCMTYVCRRWQGPIAGYHYHQVERLYPIHPGLQRYEGRALFCRELHHCPCHTDPGRSEDRRRKRLVYIGYQCYKRRLDTLPCRPTIALQCFGSQLVQPYSKIHWPFSCLIVTGLFSSKLMRPALRIAVVKIVLAIVGKPWPS